MHPNIENLELMILLPAMLACGLEFYNGTALSKPTSYVED